MLDQHPNTVTTDWRNYGSNGNGLSDNDWDWTQPGLVYPVYLHNGEDEGQNDIDIELPYFCTQGGGSGSCGDINTYCLSPVFVPTDRNVQKPQKVHKMIKFQL